MTTMLKLADIGRAWHTWKKGTHKSKSKIHSKKQKRRGHSHKIQGNNSIEKEKKWNTSK